MSIGQICATYRYRGTRIIERTNARKGWQFQVLDPNGFHYSYAYTMDGAQQVIDAALKWGW